MRTLRRAALSAALTLGLGTPVAAVSAESAHLAVPASGAYTGVYAEFGDTEDEVTLERIEDFATLVGKRQALVAFGNQWGKGRFPAEQVRTVQRAGAVPLILWYPEPTEAQKDSAGFPLEEIVAGRWDDYLDAWGRAARAIDGPLLVSWGLEMNGQWFAWSGIFHGAGAPVPGSDPPRAQGPEMFKQAYRHVVDRVRATGAANIQWVFHTNSDNNPDEPWNRMAAYYPGGEWVDWLGMSAYGEQFKDQDWVPVRDAILQPYAELAAIDPSKPILLGEWGIGEFPKKGSKGAWIREAMAAMPRLPRLKGAIFWHERWQNDDLSYSNLRVSSSLEALTAFREGIAQPFWLDRPRLVPQAGAEALPARPTVEKQPATEARPPG